MAGHPPPLGQLVPYHFCSDQLWGDASPILFSHFLKFGEKSQNSQIEKSFRFTFSVLSKILYADFQHAIYLVLKFRWKYYIPFSFQNLHFHCLLSKIFKVLRIKIKCNTLFGLYHSSLRRFYNFCILKIKNKS